MHLDYTVIMYSLIGEVRCQFHLLGSYHEINVAANTNSLSQHQNAVTSSQFLASRKPQITAVRARYPHDKAQQNSIRARAINRATVYVQYCFSRHSYCCTFKYINNFIEIASL